MKLSLGPVLFSRQKEALLELHAATLDASVDTIYLDEVVYSRRQKIRFADWVNLAEDLVGNDKEVILPSQVLSESESDLERLRKITRQDKFKVEANDMDAAKLACEHGIPFIAGASLNIYNEDTLTPLQKLSTYRQIAPFESSRDRVAEIIKVSDDIETELSVWGKMPLAYSLRCLTTRRYSLSKDGCEFRCLDYEQDIGMNTREGKPFLTVNGIQTMSYDCQNLLPHHEDLWQISVNMLRLSPQMHGMTEIARLYRDVLDGRAAWMDVQPELEKLTAGTLADDYRRGQPGIEAVREEYYDVA